MRTVEFKRARHQRSRYWTLIAVQILFTALICSVILYEYYVLTSVQSKPDLDVSEDIFPQSFMLDIVSAEDEETRLEVIYF